MVSVHCGVKALWSTIVHGRLGVYVREFTLRQNRKQR